jgi:hypothetical protein
MNGHVDPVHLEFMDHSMPMQIHNEHSYTKLYDKFQFPFEMRSVTKLERVRCLAAQLDVMRILFSPNSFFLPTAVIGGRPTNLALLNQAKFGVPSGF